MSDEDVCELCDGCGELSASTRRDDRDQVGCPACIAAEKGEIIAGQHAEIERLRAALQRYGLHTWDCGFNESKGERPCDCGWSELQAGLGDAAEQAGKK